VPSNNRREAAPPPRPLVIENPHTPPRDGAYRAARPATAATSNGGAASARRSGPTVTTATVGDRSAPAAADPRTQRALALMAQAQAAIDRGDLRRAYQFVIEAQQLGVPETQFPGKSPAMMRMHIERLRQQRDFAVVPASAEMPVAESDSDWRTNRYPVAHGVYDPASDPTRNVPAQAENDASTGRLPTEDEANPAGGEELLRQGEKALATGDRQRALELFRQAWKMEGQLDPHSRQSLQDHLQLLELSVTPPRRLDAPSPLEEVDAQQQLLLQQMYAEVTREQSVASRMRPTDPFGAVQRLKDLRQRVAQCDLDPPRRTELLTRVDRAIDATERYIEDHRAEIEEKQRNDNVVASVERDRQVKLEIQDRLAEIVEEFNTLMDQQRWEEAEILARQARELDPENEVVRMLTWKSKFARRFHTNWAMEQDKEEAVWQVLHGVDKSAIPFPDDQPLVFGDLDDWKTLSERRQRLFHDQSRRHTEAELQIREALKTEVEVRFTDRPLAEVMDTLGRAVGINVLLDETGLAAEGYTSDTPVTINLTHPISLRSALNHILQPKHLSYVIQDEVLKVTSEQTRESDVYTHVYYVADLVIPIPNFVPSYDMGLPGAIRQAFNAVGYGQPSFGSSNVPLTLLANNQQPPQNASALAQMGAAGMVPSMSNTRSPQPVGFGPGGLGGASQADFDTLIELITSTIAPTTWVDAGGSGSIEGFDTNLSLVVSQTQEVHDEIVDLLEQLRRLQDLQVTIEVRFITLQDNFFERIGIDFDFDIDDNVGNATAAGFPDDVGPSITFGLDPTGAPTVDLDLPFDQGSFGTAVPQFGGFNAATAANFGFAILSDIEAFVLIQAAQGDQRTNIMEAPKVTLFNGQQAFVSDTAQVPFVTSVIPVVGDFAAAHQPVIVVLTEGTSLSVQAVVSPDRRFVRLTLVPFFSHIGDVDTFTFDGEVSSNTGTAVIDPTDDEQTVRNNEDTRRVGTTVQLPTFAFVTVTTTVSVPDGGTVLLGGVKSLSEGRDSSGVPIMSKLPYINRLFRNVGIGRQAESLMMMVTPRIIIQEEEEEKLGIPPPP
jgi:general secretion pathway protein D